MSASGPRKKLDTGRFWSPPSKLLKSLGKTDRIPVSNPARKLFSPEATFLSVFGWRMPIYWV